MMKVIMGKRKLHHLLIGQEGIRYHKCSRWERMGRRWWRKNISGLLQHTRRCPNHCSWFVLTSVADNVKC